MTVRGWPRRLFLPLLLLAAAAGFAAEDRLTRALGGPPEQARLVAEERRLTDLINEERKQRNLPPYIVAPVLVEAARSHSREMGEKKYFSHFSPVAELNTPARRVLKCLAAVGPSKPTSYRVGENIYYGRPCDPDRAHRCLMESPSHRREIIDPTFRYVGVGVYRDGQGCFWVTQMFLEITIAKEKQR
jgi:uncharacterized protein YkwD